MACTGKGRGSVFMDMHVGVLIRDFCLLHVPASMNGAKGRGHCVRSARQSAYTGEMRPLPAREKDEISLTLRRGLLNMSTPEHS